MKAVVTGANGYIGSHLVKELLNNNYEVIAADLKHDRIDKRAIIYDGDIYDLSKNLYEEWGKPDVIIHLACKDVPIHNSPWHIESIYKNFLFLKKLIDSGMQQIITVGSMHDIGYHEGAIDEHTIPNPQTFYGVSKDTLRRILEIYTKDKDVTYQHLRFFYTYGDDEQSSGSIFSKILQMEKEGKTTFPFTDGKNQFDYININELAKQIRMVAQQKEISGIINCCSGKPISIKEKVEEFIKENNLKIRPDFGKYPSRPYDSPCVYGDNSLIKKIVETQSYRRLKCIACGKEINHKKETDTYIKCQYCNSYNFICEKNNNKDFYNNQNALKQRQNATFNEKKSKTYSSFEKIDKIISRFKKNSYCKYKKHRQKINELFKNNNCKILEIGIGDGTFLHKLLESGIDAKGIDIAENLIKNFQQKYPQYANKVSLINEFHEKVDIVYNSATFEHIDNPHYFLSNIKNNLLKDNGYLIIDNFPIVSNINSNISIDNDINFWKYIHCIIYSQFAIEKLFSKYNLSIIDKNFYDSYYYRVLSVHKEKGHFSVEKTRMICSDFIDSPNIAKFKLISFNALFRKSKAICASYILKNNIK